MHHNYQRGVPSDDESLHDADDVRRHLGGLLNLLLHGHTHEGNVHWLESTVPIFSTGSAGVTAEARPEEVANQYQLLRLHPDRIEHYTRRYDPGQKRWIGDNRGSPDGNRWKTVIPVRFESVHSLLVEEVRAYLEAMAERVAELPAYYPDRLRKSGAKQKQSYLDAIHQQVQVIEDRTALEEWLAKERERRRAAGEDIDGLAYAPARVHPEAEEDGHGVRRTEHLPPPPVPWDEQAGKRFRRAVILGDPGFGKTWLLNYEARRIALEGAEQLDKRITDLDGLVLPLLVRLSGVSQQLWDMSRGIQPIRLEEALVALAGKGRSKAFRRFVRKKLKTDRCVILLDAWDEVLVEIKEGQRPGYIPRPALEEYLAEFAKQFSKPRLLLTSRIVGYTQSPIPETQELEILAFGPLQIKAFVNTWFGQEPQVATRFQTLLRQNPAMRGLAHIPLMLALLCRDFEKTLDFPTSRAELYKRCLWGLLRDWKEGKKKPRIGDVRLTSTLWRLAEGAFRLHLEQREQFTEPQLAEALGFNLQDETQAQRAEEFIESLKADGIFITAGEHHDAHLTAGQHRDAPLTRLLFLHRTFHEYLIAHALAQKAKSRGWRAIATLIDKKAWLPEWQEVIVLLAGQLSEPGPLLDMLSKLQPTPTNPHGDDYFRHRLALAARCLPELESPHRTQCSRLVDDITTAAFSLLWWEYGLNRPVKAILRLTRARPALPGLIRALSALGQVNGRMEGTPLLEWLCEQLHTTDKEVRAAAVCAVGALEGAAVAESFLTRLAERLDDENMVVRKAAAELLAKLGSAALTNEDILTRLAELLDYKNLWVLAVAVRAVRVLGDVAATEPILTGLAKRLDDADERVRAAAEPILTRLAEMLDDEGARAAAVWTVGRLGSAAATEPFLTRLAEMLDDENERVRAATIRAVEALGSAAVTGPTGSRILARLAELLDNKDWPVWPVTVQAVGRLGSAAVTGATGSQILARLAELLAHKDREVRAAAIRAVEALGGAAATEPFLTRLAEMLDDKDWLVRAAAVQAVGALGGAVVTGPTGSRILARLAELLDDANEPVWEAAVRAIGALGDVSAIESFLARLAKWLSDKTWTTGQAMAVRAVEALGDAAATESFLTRLAELLEDEDRNVQLAGVYAVRALGSTAVTNKDILPRLAKLVDDEDWSVREGAAQAVRALGGVVASESFLTRLAERLNGGGWWGRQPAAELVGKLGSAALTNKDILPRLAERLDDENGWVREAAAEAVGRLGSAVATEPILTRLAERLYDVEWRVRKAAAEAVEALGSAAATESFLRRLAERLDDKDRAVREAAVKAVRALGSAVLINEDILPRLAKLLDDEDWLVRAAAVGAVGCLGSAAATEPILTRLAKLLDDNWAGQAAAKALERFMAQRVRIFKGRGSKWEGRTVEELSR